MTEAAFAGRILVDDDLDRCDLTTALLLRAGFDVEACGERSQTEERLRGHSYDVVITDINLPSKDGMDLLRIIKAENPVTPVILMTGYPSVETASEAVRLDAYEYLTKPVGNRSLVNAAQRALETRRLKDRNRQIERENELCNQTLEHLVVVRSQKLSEGEKRYRSLFEEFKDAIVIADGQGRFLDFNRSALDLFGFAEKDFAKLTSKRSTAVPEREPCFCLPWRSMDPSKTWRAVTGAKTVRSSSAWSPLPEGESRREAFWAMRGSFMTSPIENERSDKSSPRTSCFETYPGVPQLSLIRA